MFRQLVFIFVMTATLAIAGTATAGKDAVVIDVRTTSEYADGHLEGALNMPHTRIAALMEERAIDKDTPIKVYCASGRRAGIAKEVLEDMGYTRVENIGGYRDLVADSEAVE